MVEDMTEPGPLATELALTVNEEKVQPTENNEENKNQDQGNSGSSSKVEDQQTENEEEERPKKRIPKDIYDYPLIYDRFSGTNGVPPPPCYKRRVGRFYVYIQGKTKDGDPKLICMLGPAWPMIAVTLTLIVGISTLAFFFTFQTLPIWLIPIGVIIQVTTIICYFLTACSNPGIEPLTFEVPDPENDYWVYDKRFGAYFDKSKRTIYSREANVVARDVDHFCPWTGTLIAEDNMFFFKCFNGWLCVLCVFTILAVIIAVAITSGDF